MIYNHFLLYTYIKGYRATKGVEPVNHRLWDHDVEANFGEKIN